MKTQTRRAVKPMGPTQAEWLTPELLHSARMGCLMEFEGLLGWQMDHPGGGPLGWIDCPYGKPGDFLWVRETSIIAPKAWTSDWSLFDPENVRTDYEGCRRVVSYPATTGQSEAARSYRLKATPSIHMPRWASRITLRVTSVRVERLQEISEADARAEGATAVDFYPDDGFPLSIGWTHLGDDGKCVLYNTARRSFEVLWESLNGAGSWDANPWVWVVGFERADAVPAGAVARPILFSGPMVRALLA